jgi:hypothetical protein
MAKRSRSPKRCPKGSSRVKSRCVKRSPKKSPKSSYKPPYKSHIKKTPVKSRDLYLAKLKRYVRKLKEKMNNPRVNYDYMYLTAKNRDVRYIKDRIEDVKRALSN